MKILTKNFLWAIFGLFLAAYLFSMLFSTMVEQKKLSISEIAAAVNASQVKSIEISGSNLSLTMKDESEATGRKEEGEALSTTFRNYGVAPERLSEVVISVKDESGARFLWEIVVPTLLPLLVMGLIFWFLFRQARQGAAQAFTFGRSNIRLFAGGEKDQTTFAEVAGLKEAKQELFEVVDFLKNPKKFLDMGAKIPRGVLLVGAPGTGKTLLARAVAGESGVPFFSISASEFVEMFVGVGAARTRDAFATAKKAAPAILFIDEIDAVGRQRGVGMGGGNDEREQTLNQILTEMDGFERDTQLIVLAATNRPDVLDAALLRPGRFDRRVVLDMPDMNDREEILAIHLKGKPIEEGLSLRKVAIRTPGFSGADLANLANEAAILAARIGKQKVSEVDLLESVEKVMLGPERKGRIISDKERKVTAYHEAGHALVAASLENSDPVHKVSIVSRGFAGGYTLKLPNEENRLRTRSQFLSDLTMIMGGYAAEETVFSDMSTGASNDLKKAAMLARDLVARYGMSEKIGPVAYLNDEMTFLGREISDKNYSEASAAKIDEEISVVIKRAYEMAKKIVISRRKALDAISQELLKKEVLEEGEFRNLYESFKFKKLAVA
ncbi:MAG: ATP-dependent zinc metalloprotease FtsH [Candidatus Harrisonbacteria bacterium]|nr:ATP-dependent zinc metalloprotease FtsH [Candidatus Harrisonbacteria bacterium]